MCVKIVRTTRMYIIIIVISGSVVIPIIGFYPYEEMSPTSRQAEEKSRQAILEQTRVGYAECLRNFAPSILRWEKQIDELTDCVEKLVDNLEEWQINCNINFVHIRCGKI